ncbi:MAG: ABC1 kinase family protein, partial [Sciscionella sp.]
VATLFAEFNDEPVAAASIAQVHAATLRDGTRVAVKVRRPRLTMKVERDLRLLRLLAGILQHAGTVGALANPVAIVEDFAATLRSELDFRNEGVYLAEFARNLAAGDNYQIIVPLPVEGMVSPRVLVMTYIDGTPIDDIESLRASGHDGQELLRIAVRAWIESALVHGLFHGDVHAGNLFVTSEGRVAFLDFGIMGRLDAHARDVLGHLLRALLVDADYVSAVQAVFELGVISQPIHNWADAASELGTLIEPLRTARLSDIDYGEVLGRVVHIAARYHVRLPREFVLVVKQLLYFERYSKQLAPDFRILNDPTILPLLLRPMQPGPRATPESHG